MKAMCEKCKGIIDEEQMELEFETVYPGVDCKYITGYYRHGRQVAVDDFRYCGPIIVVDEVKDG